MDRSAYDRWFSLETTHFWRIARRELVVDLVDRYKPPGDRLRLLDVGGACSLISREIQRFGEVTVIEPDAATAEFARSALGVDARTGSLPGPLPVEGLFDVITLLDVIEHIDDDAGAVRSVLELLAPRGLLLVTVPAVPLLWSDHDVSVHHKRRYMKPSLRRALEDGGVAIERMSYHTSLLFPVIAAQRLASRARGVGEKAEYGVKVPPAPLNRLFGGVMRLEKRLIDRFDLPIGSSLVAVCRRS